MIPSVVKYAGALLFLVLCWQDSAGDILYDRDSLYHHIRVTQLENYRYLSFDRTRGSQSVINLDNHDELKFAYTRAMFVALGFLEDMPKRVLFVGLGGGSMPRIFSKYCPDIQIDIAEIDPDVVNAAKEYFFFKPTNMMKVHAMDGRQYLKRNDVQYDLIFLDAYNNHSIPFHLTTREFFELVRRRLKPRGAAASNVWSPSSNEYFDSQINTIKSVFPRFYDFDAVGSGNHIFVSTMQSDPITQEELQKRIDQIFQDIPFPFSVNEFIRTYEDLTQKEIQADILTDDFAPVNVMRSQRTN
ncbi:MAG: fused MFS/spermidine synthase [Candidatus Omnitrophica bacterium]|nr:fused MFS/spermidine synthase [Candidatus Omnitrophota bacterium]